jgi:hypothetical protein
MRDASRALVNIDELNAAAGAAIARMLGAEAAFVTAGALVARSPSSSSRRSVIARPRSPT